MSQVWSLALRKPEPRSALTKIKPRDGRRGYRLKGEKKNEANIGRVVSNQKAVLEPREYGDSNILVLNGVNIAGVPLKDLNLAIAIHKGPVQRELPTKK